MENKIKSLAFHILVPIMLSFIIWMLIPDYTVFYNGLAKPAPQLPEEAFVIAWCAIYFLMGIAATVAEFSEVDQVYKQKAFNLYYLKLLVNLLWMPVMFGFRNLFVAAVWSVLLFVLTALVFWKFLKLNRKCGLLLLPYLLWTVFLIYYSVALWIMNK